MAIKYEEGINTVKHGSTRNFWETWRFSLGCKSRIPVIPAFVLVLLGLVVSGLIMEAQIVSRAPETTGILSDTKDVCSPSVIHVNITEYHSGHRFYSAMKENPVPAPIFRGNHSWLCEDQWRAEMRFGYCLPISGRKDTPFCTAADRMDLLSIHSHNSTCYASVLHMLLVEVYEELKATGNTPLITFGSLLGAVRNGSMIPFTEDTDIGFVGELKASFELQEALRRKGYHMFFSGIWRVCVAPTHPLAGRLYDPSLPLTWKFSVPYVDLYKMKKLSNGSWDIQELEGGNGRLMSYDKVEPFSEVTINGMPFDMVRDPKFFLTEASGADYMTPKLREVPDMPAALVSKQKLLEVVKMMKKKKIP
ncbi:hypothetical protein PF008_g8078 [Phytophthora fragariae]|uniref:LicD family protein n=1 Tax=Phytophthora fragariae TaxID=53985 RepID=A0A6G0S0T7_9STRA|nr:hypothetical protein PF008_g8078 [Phytophthora fragariae]